MARGYPSAADLSGRVFSRWTVVRRIGTRCGKALWFCLCACGNTGEVLSGNLVSGKSRSCGCLSVEAVVRRSTTHGHATRRDNSSEYTSWCGMNTRCTNPKHAAWRHYGGRGIAVCDRWRWSFETFLADMGQRPAGTSLDRIDVNGNYEPGNCRWATYKQQSANRRCCSGHGPTMIDEHW